MPNNSIQRIEHLEGCRNLRELWLNSNRIRTIENLDDCTFLQSLYLQDNLVSVIENLQVCVDLRDLVLSQNPITAFVDIAGIAELPMLKRLSFADENFEPCPIANEPGYREFILTTVTSAIFAELDSIRVNSDSREQARRTYIEAAMKLQERLGEIESEHSSMLHHLEGKHRESEEQLKYVHRMLVDDLHGLKSDVDAGRQMVLKEQERLNALRVHSEAKLKQDLSRIQVKFVKEVDRLVEEQGAKFAVNPRQSHEVLQQEALSVLEFERDLALSLIDMLYSSQGLIIYSESQEFSAEYKYIQSLTQDLLNSAYTLHKVYQVADARSVEQTDFCFVTVSIKDLQQFMTQRSTSSRLFSYSSALECLRGQRLPCLLLVCRGVYKEDSSPLSKQEIGRLTVDYIASLIKNSGSSFNRNIVDDRIATLISDTSVRPS